MPDRSDIAWFKRVFAARIAPAIAGTPFSLDFIVGLACQETGEVWSALRRARLSLPRVLELCVGDTLDASAGRRAFPRDKAALLAAPDGAAMFAIARQSLVDMARYVPAYRGAARNARKFCRGFGLFQRDLQFFRQDPQYFLQRRYADFEQALSHALGELQASQQRAGLADRAQLSVLEQCAVAIAYNTGRYDPRKGLRQGYRAPGGKYYGEALLEYLRLSQTVAAPGTAALIALPARAPAQAGPQNA